MLRPDLDRMARQIAANFSYLGAEEAASQLASHLERFWTPAMRSELLAASPAELSDPIVRAAADLLRAIQPAG
jgi:formate dehydrogenase subunit delta